jgi:hypothetical protein
MSCNFETGPILLKRPCLPCKRYLQCTPSSCSAAYLKILLGQLVMDIVDAYACATRISDRCLSVFYPPLSELKDGAYRSGDRLRCANPALEPAASLSASVLITATLRNVYLCRRTYRVPILCRAPCQSSEPSSESAELAHESRFRGLSSLKDCST